MLESALAPYGEFAEAEIPPAYVEGAALVRPVLVAGAKPRAAVVLATMAVRAAGASVDLAPQTLVTANALGADVAVLRDHTPDAATVAEPTAAGLFVTLAEDEPRWALSGRLQIGAPRTNYIADARTPFGTGWTNTGIASAVSADGPDGAAGQGALVTESSTTSNHRTLITTGLTAVIGQSYTLRWLLKAGTCLNAQLCFSGSHGLTGFQNFGLTGDGVIGTGGAGVTYAGIARYGDWYLVTMTATATSAAAVAVALMMGNTTANNRLASFLGSGRTITSGWAWLTDGAGLVMPVLPPIGAPQVSQAGADVPIWTPAAFPQRGCILLRGTLEALAGASALGLAQIDDGTDDARIVARVGAGGGQPELLVVSGGVTLATLTPAEVLAAGAEFRALIAWSPGGVRFGTGAGGVVSASLPRPAGLSRVLLGQANAAGSLPMGGELVAEFYPIWPSEAEAAALLAA